MNVKSLFKNLFLVLLPCLFLISCRQIIVVNNTSAKETVGTTLDIHTFFSQQIFNSTFFLCCFLFLVVAFLLSKYGYRLLEKFFAADFKSKCVYVFVTLAAILFIGCIPIDTYGLWFAIPVCAFMWSLWYLILEIRYRCSNAIRNPKYKRHRNIVLLGKLMLAVWCLGWVLYFIPASFKEQPHVGIEVLFRPAIYATDMFLLKVDGRLLKTVEQHDLLKGLLVSVNIVANICMMILLLSIVALRLKAYLHVKHIRVDNIYNHLYVFFGLDDATKLLAEDIKKDDPHSVIVYVENSLAGEEEQDEAKSNGWKNILSLLTHRQKTFTDISEDNRCALAIAGCKISSIDSADKDVWSSAGLDVVKKLINSLVSIQGAELHIFFLSENREDNVIATSRMCNDETNKKIEKTRFYCHARRNGVNRVLENDDKVVLVDSSYLAVEHLKTCASNHPINFVDVETIEKDNPGAVSTPFVSLIIGFGETGQEAFKFLYEYSSFLNTNASAHNSRRSLFVCHVVDCKMSLLEGAFFASVPVLNKKATNCCFHSCDYRSLDFYKNILTEYLAAKLNYVVIAVGNDEENMEVAVEILRYVRRYRKDLGKFRIYVRAYEKGSFKHLEDIARHYNNLLGVEFEKENIIVIFGQNQAIYQYEYIVNDKFMKDGKNYYDTYRSLKLDPSSDSRTWEERHNKIANKENRILWERKSEIRRKESQDRSNALHANTKRLILEKTIGEENVIDFCNRTIGCRAGSNSDIRYTNLSSQENKLMLNLAMTEHLRWMAAHEMMGYVENSEKHECNERTKQHNCLIPWQMLDDESTKVDYDVDFKLFDFGVVETTLKMILQDDKESD